MAIGEGAVWSLNPSIARLLRIDPKTNSVVKQIPVRRVRRRRCRRWRDLADKPGSEHGRSDGPENLSRGARRSTSEGPIGGRRHAASRLGRQRRRRDSGHPSVSRIDPASNKVVATIPLGPTSACCALHMGVIAAGGVVWVVVPQANSVVRIDPATNEKTVFKLDFPPCAYLDADESTVWSTGGACADVVGRLDVRTHGLTKLVEPHPIGLKIAFGHVWVVSLAAGNVDQIDRAQIRSWHDCRRWPPDPPRGRIRLPLGARRRGRILRVQPTR